MMSGSEAEQVPLFYFLLAEALELMTKVLSDWLPLMAVHWSAAMWLLLLDAEHEAVELKSRRLVMCRGVKVVGRSPT